MSTTAFLQHVPLSPTARHHRLPTSRCHLHPNTSVRPRANPISCAAVNLQSDPDAAKAKKAQPVRTTVVASPDVTTQSVNEELLSPMMREYVATKRGLYATLCDGSDRTLLLMYRVGDFFESFFEDAHQLSKTCEIALTSKEAGKALGVRVPMAGVPHFALDDKIKTLVAANVTVAVVDQVQAASQKSSGQLVKRAVTRLITPATVAQDNLVDTARAAYIASVVAKPPHRRAAAARAAADQSALVFRFGFAYADLSTGEFRTTDGENMEDLRRLLVTLAPAELLVTVTDNDAALSSGVVEEASQAGIAVITRRQVMTDAQAEAVVTGYHKVDNIESFGCRQRPHSVQAAAQILSFVRKTLVVGGDDDDATGPQLNFLTTFSTTDFMMLDASCMKNLEVLRSVRDGSRERSLQWAVDRTVTSMGARCLRSWLVRPSMDLATITARQNVVEVMMNNGYILRGEVQALLKGLADLERLGGRVGTGRVTPRELRWLAESVLRLPSLFMTVQSVASALADGALSSDGDAGWACSVDGALLSLAGEVRDAMLDPAPAFLVSEVTIQGGALAKENWSTSAVRIFRDGYNDHLDNLRRCVKEPDAWIAALEARERGRTKVDGARIKHVKNVGYVLRVPRVTAERVMDSDTNFFARLGYTRVQSTKAEIRFQFDELRAHEREFNAAVAEMLAHELRLFAQLRERIARFVPHLRALGARVAGIDVLTGFAQVAEEWRFVRPELLPKGERVLEVVEARHAIVEQMLGAGRTFVPNSFALGGDAAAANADLMLLCGPNAAGKSCALRSVGLLTILAQVGCFVPARRARMSVCDRIFTRVGAVDDMARGQSTFQVEMAETACILSHATAASLVLLDEIGRGTSTVDGIAIAWSVAERLSQGGRRDKGYRAPRGVFVTHFHELNHLAVLYGNVQSFHVEMVRADLGNAECELDDVRIEREWISTHNIVAGASYVSLGLSLAERAGFPAEVMVRAREIAKILAMPSKLLGSELRSALSSGQQSEGNGCAREADAKEEEEMTEEACRQSEAEYEEGFKAGYQKALEEVSSSVQGMLDRSERGPSL